MAHFLGSTPGGGQSYYNKLLQNPEYPGGKSGVTIGIGYDLGYNTQKSFNRDWSPYMSSGDMNALSSVIGLKGAAANNALSSVSGVSVPWSSASSVFNNTTLPKFIAQTAQAYPGSSSLSPDSFGALVSMTFNRGTAMTSRNPVTNANFAEKRMIRDAIIDGDAGAVPDLIRQSERVWTGTSIQKAMYRRREGEAALFQQGLSTP